MKRILILYAAAVFIASCSLGLNNPEKKTDVEAEAENIQQGSPSVLSDGKAVADYVIVKTSNNFDKKEFEMKGFEVQGSISPADSENVYWYLYKRDENRILELANSIKGVLSCEYDYYVAFPTAFINSGLPVGTAGSEAKPQGLLQGSYTEDPVSHSSDYALALTHALDAYKEVGYGTNETVAAILDTGLNMEHKDFKDGSGKSIVLYAKSCAQTRGGVYIGDDKPFTEIPLGENWDGHGHGSHCAGIAAAFGDNNAGIAGVAWKNTKLISY